MPSSLRPALAVLSLALVGCSFDPAPPTDSGTRPSITCSADSECPSGWLCPRSLGRCVLIAERDDIAPALAGQPTLAPALGTVGQRFTLTFTVSEPLGVDPVATLDLGRGRSAPFDIDEAQTDRAALRYVFGYVARGAEDEGTRGVTLDLVDAAGNAVANLSGGSLMLDFTAPRVVTAALTPGLAAVGTPVSLELELSEPLPAAPQVELVHADGSTHALVAAGTVGTQGYTYTYTPTGLEQEGDAAVRVTGSDAAGNLLDAPRSATLRLDFSPPTLLRTLVAPQVARAGQRVVVEVDLAEDLSDGGTLLAVDVRDDAGTQLWPEVSRTSSGIRFERTVSLGNDGRYRLELLDTTDLAGNRAPSLLVGEVLYDSTPPLISNLATDAPRYSAQPGHDTVTLTFDVDDPLTGGSLDVRLWSKALTCGAVQATPPHVTCTLVLDGTEPEGVAVVSVRALDAAGNEGVGSTLVRLDFTPPALVPGTLELTLQPRPGCVALSVTRWGQDATTRVSFVLDEAVGALPLVRTATPEVLDFTRRTGTSTSFSFEHTLASAGLTQGTYTLEAVVTDEVGNSATLALPLSSPLVIDTAAPTLTVGQANVRFVRSPWGSAVAEGSGATGIPAGPFFALAPAEPLDTTQSTLPASTFALDDGAPLLLQVWADGQRGSLIGATPPNSDGSWPRLRLANLDTPAAWVSALDGACNASSTVRLDQAEWVATARPPDFGAAVHATWTTPRMTPTLSQPYPLAQPVPGSTLAAPDQVAQLAAGAPGWEQLSAPTPTLPGNPSGSGVLSPTAAYDSARGRMVYFSAGATRETWEWDGLRWTKVTPLGDVPPQRNAHALAYDSARGRVVLFSGSTTVADTWEWDGATWTNVTPAAGNPPARRNAAMAYDSVRQRVVLFGGTGPGSVYLNDTWEWDGAVWVRRVVSGPSARNNTSMAFDTARGRVVLFGGRSSVNLGDTWEWDGARWWNVSPGTGAPSARLGASMDYDTVRRRVLLYGGNGLNTSGSTVNHSDVWEWDGTAWRDVTPSTGSPYPRSSHAHAFDTHRGRLVVFGGSVYSIPGPSDTWEWDGQRWIDATPSPSNPPAFASHAMAYDADRGRVVLFGGMVSFAHQQQTWEYGAGQWRQLTSLTPPPGARINHAMAYDPVRKRTVLFGGDSYGGTLRDTWEWDGQSWLDVTPTTGNPPARYRHAMAWDPVSQRVLLFGGYIGFQDTWAWNGVSWVNVTPSGSPAARTSIAMATDLVRNRVVLFGGQIVSPSAVAQDTWEWDGTSWTNVTPAAGNPAARSRHAMAWDARSGRVVLFGGGTGSGSTYRDDTWEWDGTSWTQIDPQPSAQRPPGRYDHALAWDGERVLVLGGHDQLFRGETWRYDSRPTSPPALGFSARASTAGFALSQLEGLRVRAHCGASVGGTAGAQLLGWFTSGLGRPAGGWSALAANATDAATVPPYLPPPPGAFLEWSAASAAEARGLFALGDSTFNVACSPVAAPGLTFARVAMDAVELRVRYRTQ